MKKKKYSIILLYPPNGPHPEIYYNWAMGRNVEEAIEQVRRDCAIANGWDNGDEMDFIAAFDGWIEMAWSAQDLALEIG